jgi:excisionase family DNA binding protein
MSISTAASLFSVQRSTIYRRISTGTLTGYAVNNKVYVDGDEMLGWKEHLRRSRQSAVRDLVDALWQDGLPDADIAVKVGRSRERVRQIRSSMGKRANPRRPRLPKGTYLR